jgi:hypothetical protein
MFFPTTAFLALVAAAQALVAATNDTASDLLACGTNPSKLAIAIMEAHFETHRLEPTPTVGAAATTTIDVYFHVRVIIAPPLLIIFFFSNIRALQNVYKATTAVGGYLPDANVTALMKSLNTGYTLTRMQFKLKKTTRTLNANWFSKAGPGNAEQTAMKNALREGGAGDLNIYSVGFESGSGELDACACVPRLLILVP